MDVAVAWLHEHRELFDDPLSNLEEMWEAFDHAEELNHLIRWMPAQPGAHTGEPAIMRK
jgi:hypothetical protein